MSEVIQGLLLVLAICALIFPTGYILWIWLVRYFENDDTNSSSKKSRTCGECWYYNRETHHEPAKYTCYNRVFGARYNTGKTAPKTKACKGFTEKE